MHYPTKGVLKEISFNDNFMTRFEKLVKSCKKLVQSCKSGFRFDWSCHN